MIYTYINFIITIIIIISGIIDYRNNTVGNFEIFW